MKIVCPYCFKKFAPSEVMFRCTNTDPKKCTKVDDPEFNKHWDVQDKYRPVIQPKKSLFGGNPKSGKCGTCGQESHTTICPHCHNELPNEMIKKGGKIISIIGAKGSGKTNYITTLIHELSKKGHHLEIGILPTMVGRDPDEYTANRYKKDFFNLLYNEKEMAGGTKAGDPKNKIPLIYKLFSTEVDEHIYLVLYDTAGEDFTQKERIKDHAEFLQNSDGIIMLLDTLSVDDVYGRLKGKIPDHEKSEYNLIIENIIDYFDKLPNSADYYKKSLALAFSKIDAIITNEREFEEPLPNIRMNANSGYFGGEGYDLDEMESVDMGIKAGLESWDEMQFIKNINSPAHFNNKARFFGISALGENPEAGKVKSIKPFRVLDPLIWILHTLKFPLPTKKIKK